MLLMILIYELLSIEQHMNNSNAEVVKILIEKGASVKALDDDK